MFGLGWPWFPFWVEIKTLKVEVDTRDFQVQDEFNLLSSP